MKKFTSIFLTLLVVLLCMALPVNAATYNGISQVIHVNATADKIVIDGKIDGDEWGKPIISTTPEKIMEMYNMSWNYTGDKNANANQRVDIYVTNDGGVLYVACKVTNTDYDDSAQDITKLRSKYPHFGFTMATYNEDQVVPSMLYMEKTYEIFGHFGIGMVNGQKVCATKSQGYNAKPLYRTDYEIGYDAATRTYVYEVRVAEDLTTVNLTSDSDVVMSFDVGCLDNGKYGGYMISDVASKVWQGLGGGNQLAHRKGFPIIVIVNTTAELAKPEFVPTANEAGLDNAPQDGFSDVMDANVVHDQAVPLPPTTIVAITLAALAVLMIITAAIVLLIERRHS